MLYVNIRNAVKTENETRYHELISFIENGYIDSENDKYNRLDAGIERESTPRRWEQYQNGQISRDKAIEYAKIRASSRYAIELGKEYEKIESVENAGKLIDATITIEWKRSKTWGNNPTAELCYSYLDNNGDHRCNRVQGCSVGGCGYDKESTAAAQVMKHAPELLKPLYDAVEQNPGKDIRDILGYGSGYGVRPYFEGGVGINCFGNIFSRLGFQWRNVSSGKAFDVYTITAVNS